MKGYQYLENDFFSLCKTRKIKPIPMLLYIYLRGLYCRFQKPKFTWTDRVITDQLGISQPTLQLARKMLMEKGLLLFKSGNGLSHPTEYTLLGNVLLPELKVKESYTKGARSFHLHPQKLSPSNEQLSSYQRVKKRIGIPSERFKGTTEEERSILRTAGLLR